MMHSDFITVKEIRNLKSDFNYLVYTYYTPHTHGIELKHVIYQHRLLPQKKREANTLKVLLLCAFFFFFFKYNE